MRQKLVFTLGLTAITLAVYLQARHFDYINFDDHLYILDNFHIQQGFSRSTIYWALTAVYQATWQPLVWLSFMLDYKMGGLYPGTYHLTNVIFHVLNTLLLLIVLNRLTKAFWKSLFVAALFALHPLHVESVAWIAERKDVLSTFFLFLTLWAYAGYLDRPSYLRYGITLSIFGLAFLAKPMVVSLPLLLLLFDFWPRGRMTSSASPRRQLWNILREKIPFFVLSVFLCVIAFWVQTKGGAIRTIDQYSLGIRIQNAIVSYVQYIGKMVWPFDLGFYYPHPGAEISLPLVIISAVFLICISILAARSYARHPVLLFGWLWYLITLLPVIGLVQFGDHGLADRFTYIPLIGLFVIVAWEIPGLVAWILSRLKSRPPHPATLKWSLGLMAGLVLSLLTIRTYDQIGYWKNDLTLFSHTAEITQNNPVVDTFFCTALARNGMAKDAIPMLLDLAKRFPTRLNIYTSLAFAFEKNGNLDKAVVVYKGLLKEQPANTTFYHNLANIFEKQNKLDDAIRLRRQAIRIEPDYANFHIALARNLAARGDYREAWQEIQLTRTLGCSPPLQLLQQLSSHMPEPRQ